MAALNQNLDRAFDLFELTPANEISFLHAYKKTLRKCCIDPIETTRLLGMWIFCLWCGKGFGMWDASIRG
jgi:hypothetical protein